MNSQERPGLKVEGKVDYDCLEIRCPKLGGQVTFGYCRREGGRLPCPRSLVCWQLYFPVEAHLKTCLTPEEWARCFVGAPKSRIDSLLECIEAAKQRVGE